MADLSSFDRNVSAEDLELAAEERLQDAEALFEAERYATSIAYGILALEVRLKVVVCRHLDLKALPVVLKTHNLEHLILYAGLSRKIDQVKRPRQLRDNWQSLLKTSLAVNNIRYKPHPEHWTRRRAARSCHNSVMPQGECYCG